MDAELRAALPPRVCGVRFLPRSLRIIRDIIAADPDACRRQIAEQVGAALDWRDARGEIKRMGATSALLAFHRRGWITLPPPRKPGRTVAVRRAVPPRESVPPQPAIAMPLAALRPITLQPVRDAAQSRLWNGFIGHYHYQGYTPLCGAQLRYLVHSPRGWLGAMSFSAAALALRDRDRFIGWTPATRARNRALVVNHSRFLILPWVRVPHLASHLLAQAARRVAADFAHAYGYRPVLLESFVETPRFAGTCYRAANWTCVGHTRGRGRGDRRSARELRENPSPLPIKAIWMYPLQHDWRQHLCAGAAA